jgi:hypothetical protein
MMLPAALPCNYGRGKCLIEIGTQGRGDYRKMREMFFSEPPTFDSLMADLRELEDRINRFNPALTPKKL